MVPRPYGISATVCIQIKQIQILVCKPDLWLNALWHNKHHQNQYDMMKYESVTVAHGCSPDRLALWRCHNSICYFPPALWNLWEVCFSTQLACTLVTGLPMVYIHERPPVFILQHQKFLRPCCTVLWLFKAPAKSIVTDKPIFSCVYGLLENA